MQAPNMIELGSVMYRRQSPICSSLIPLILLLSLMISSQHLVKGTKEHLSSGSHPSTDRTSNNSLPSSETSRIIDRLTSNSTVNVKRKEPSDLVEINTHQIPSSSTQHSFFDSTNRDKDPTIDASYLIGISPEFPDSNYFTSDSKLINRFRQPLLMNEYDLRAHLSPMAFGHSMGGGLTQPDSSGPQIYEAQTNYPVSGATNNLENSFYVNMMGAQPLAMANDKFQDEGASSDFSNNQYANPTNEVYSPSTYHGAHQNYIYSGGSLTPQDYAKQAFIMANQQRFDLSGQKDQITRNQKILTNAQIVSLIDELKEFNARKLKEALSGGARTKNVPTSSRRKLSDDQQSSKINRAVNEFAKNLRNSKKTKDNDSDDDTNKSNNNNHSDDDHDSDDESERREDDTKNEDDDELKKEDLQKLASFIFEQQKENKRLANAQRKNSRPDGDDEDTDMRDSLLEGTRKSRANEEQQSSMKHTKESPTDNAQLLELLKKLSNKTNLADDSNSYEDNDKTGDREDSDKARKRRANEETSSSTNSLRKLTHNDKSPLVGLITDNLSNYESSEVSLAPKEKSIVHNEESWVGQKASPKLKGQVNKRVGHVNEATSSFTSNEGGEEDSEYPRSERMKDLETLRESLARSREAQLKLSRIPLPLTPLFRDALNNELIKVTDQTVIESSGIDVDKTDSKDSKSWRDQPEVGEESTNSDLSPSRAEPENSAKKTKGKLVDRTEEYPISETVNDRINKLSHNLDRYFNDGFLDKFENKSETNLKSRVNQAAESRVELQVQPRKNSSKILEKKNKKAEDDDFDINVAIDGKRDTTDLEDEMNGEKRDKNGRVSLQKSTSSSDEPKRGTAVSGEKVKKSRRSNKDLPIRVTPLKARRHVRNHGTAQRQKKHHQPEKILKPDPVDSETLDTPIGPDDKRQSRIRGIEKSKGFKEKLHSYSRNGEKFFQEPD